MTTTKIMELELTKLQGNKYNPRKTMDKKGLASLEKSLERDGQLQTILVRPIDGNKYEVVAGMRRYLSLKNLGEKKVVCTVQEMDDQTAMQRAFKENMEREALSPVDEASWFFKMLGLKEEQLFVSKEGEHDGVVLSPLPGYQNPIVQDLAKVTDFDASVIEKRLPLLALPENLQMKVGSGEKAEIPITKAQVLARLRLIENEKEAHEQMVAVWKNASTDGTFDEQLRSLSARVKSIIDDYDKKSEEVMKELIQLERIISKHREKMKMQLDEATSWLDTKSKTGLFQSLPKLVAENFEIEKPKDTRIGHFEYKYLDEIATALTRDESLSDADSKLAIKVNNLLTGKKNIEDDECAYCGTHIEMKNLENRIEEIDEKREAIEKDIKLKDKLRADTEKLKRSLGTIVREYDDAAEKYKGTLKTLVANKHLTKEQANAKLKEVLIEER